MRRIVLLAVVLVVAGCREDAPGVPLSEWEVADLQAARYDFRAYPGSVYRADQTSLLERAHFVLNPAAKEAPPTLVLESRDPLDSVARWYAEAYGYGAPADSPGASESSKAYYRPGNLSDDAEAAKPLFEALELGTNPAAAKGDYRAAHISATERLPRITLQRPWFDARGNQVNDTTLIVMVREDPQYFQ